MDLPSNTVQPNSSSELTTTPVSRHQAWLGPALVFLLICAIEALSRTSLRLPNPPALLLMAVVFSSFSGGLRSGILSAGLAWLYFAYYFSNPDQRFTYTDENLRRVVVWIFATPAMAVMTGLLKRRADRASADMLRSEREHSAQLAQALEEQKKAEDALRRARDELEVRVEERTASERSARQEAERANHLKDEFILTVSHELRTPLTAVVGWISMLKHGTLDAAATSHALDVIERCAKNEAALVEDLLDMSSVMSGRLRLESIQLDLKPVLATALDAVRPAAEAKNIALHLHLESPLGRVPGDPVRLRQVLWNILSNALKFTPKDGRIDVRVGMQAQQVLFSVRDNGIGIVPEYLPFVFDRFSQQDSSTTRHYGGMGVGLAISRYLVEAHGGTISVESAGTGKGTTVTVLLPALGGLDEAPLLPAAGKAGKPSLDGLKLLLVDDDEDTRDILSSILKSYGANVRVTASVEETLTALRQNKPDVILADIGMPGEDGYSLIRRLKGMAEHGRDIPAIAVTAYAKSDDRKKSLAAGFRAHVTKPVEPDELAAAVASVAGRN
jgi:signal transduction histidine kinase